MSRIREDLENRFENYIFPFFWQNGAEEETIRCELNKIYESNIRAFCVEARPHPDYGGPRWWHDMDIILGFAKEHGMKVWLLDDDRFPTGHANGAFTSGDDPLSVRFLTVHNTDVAGPKKQAYLLIRSLLSGDDELVGVLAAKRTDPANTDLSDMEIRDLTDHVKDGWLCFDIPEGLWRILVFYTTRKGNGKLDYFNILDSASVRVLIDRIYETHYAHYKDLFGNTFMGFFSDEPEFSNLPWYDFQAKLGKNMPFIPWSRELQDRLNKRWGEKFLFNLPALWYQAGKNTMNHRYAYMDEVTKQLSVSFSGQISDWCKAHNVSHIGHVIEDDNVHGRLGCGTGHYFRSLSGMRMAGIDVVLFQIMPGMDQEEHQWVASSRDGEFFHYGLAKMGSSLAHIDPKKQGDSMCEIFGAFGWQEGIGLMKWLTDHMISAGINHFVPHAFSMKPFPDPDCAPHFYAHGNHAQFQHFGILMNYMNRLCHLFTGGRYPASVGVLYHADAEWAGEAMLFQKPARVLLENQIDFDVIPADLLKEENSYGASFRDGICLNGNVYKILLIPGCERLPLVTAEFIRNHGDQMQIVFVGRRPEGICEEISFLKETRKIFDRIPCLSLEELADFVRKDAPFTVRTDQPVPHLRTYPYFGMDGDDYLFCFNEDTVQEAAGRMQFKTRNPEGSFAVYDAVRNQYEEKAFTEGGFDFCLRPGEAAVFVMTKDSLSAEGIKEMMASASAGKGADISGTRQSGDDSSGPEQVEARRLDGRFEIEACRVKEDQWISVKTAEEGDPLPDMTSWLVETGFNGYLQYKTEFELDGKTSSALQVRLRLKGAVDCADIYVDGSLADRLIGNTMDAVFQVSPGKHTLIIRLPLTPVWSVGDPWSSLSVLSRVDLTERPVLYVKKRKM